MEIIIILIIIVLSIFCMKCINAAVKADLPKGNWIVSAWKAKGYKRYVVMYALCGIFLVITLTLALSSINAKGKAKTKQPVMENNFYSILLTVDEIDVKGNLAYMIDQNGELWEFDANDYKIGETYICVMNTNGTEKLSDDLFIDMHKIKNHTTVKIFHTDTQKELNKMFDYIESNNGNLVIEITNGTVLDTETGDGVFDNGEYIHYPEGKYTNGDRIQSVFIYNPNSNYIDDILYRIDVLLSETK